MSEKQFSSDPTLHSILADTAERINRETGEVIEPTVVATQAQSGILTESARPEVPPYCMPLYKKMATVEVAPGIMVSEHLIRSAVESTSAGDTPQDHQDYYRSLKRREKTLHEEVKKDLKASKKFVQEMFERANNPPNAKEKYVSFDAMSTSLQRVVKAYTAATEANKELDEAIKALAAEPRTSS